MKNDELTKEMEKQVHEKNNKINKTEKKFKKLKDKFDSQFEELK